MRPVSLLIIFQKLITVCELYTTFFLRYEAGGFPKAGFKVQFVVCHIITTEAALTVNLSTYHEW